MNRFSRDLLNVFIELDGYKYSEEDLGCDSIFDRLDLAKPLFVPAYNPDKRWQLKLPHKVSEIDGNLEDVREYSKKLTESRLSDFYDLSFDFWNLVMLHIHEPDAVQDVELGDYRQDYERLDGIAEDIIESFGDEWTIIFMSDHGRMGKGEHNTNAFYSCNRELFDDETPHITDFHDKILELVE